MTQTAVSQIFAQIKAARKDNKFWNVSMLVDWLLESEETFKAIEKEQIMKTAIKCHFEGVRQPAKTSQGYIDYAEQWYEQTYGGNK